jgi:hypothetical protein
MVTEVLGQRADVDAVREQRAGESCLSAWNPFSRHGVTPAARSAGCQVFRFQSPHQIAPPAGAVNVNVTVTFWRLSVLAASCVTPPARPPFTNGYFRGVNDVEQLPWLRPEVTVTLTFTR